MQHDPEAGAPHVAFMRLALKEAEAAAAEGEVPVGCVIVHQGLVVARAHNQRERLLDPTAHAEMVAITQAATALGDWRIEGTTCYATLEPCAMCAGAMVLARVPTLVFGAWDPKAGACGSVLDVTGERRLNHRVEVVGGVLADESSALLTDFFRRRRTG